MTNPSPSLCAQLACLWEATARKAGNVHRQRDFADLKYIDFLHSAAAIGPAMQRACQQQVGQTVLQAIQATRAVVASNTNLGMVLLLVPLATVSPEQTLQAGVEKVLERLDLEDARAVYAAIRLAGAGGLGKVARQDVAAEPTLPLREAMVLAADRDMIARQYAKGYREVFEIGVPALAGALKRLGNMEEAIQVLHLTWLARFPDSLILRKRGIAEAEEASQRAKKVLESGWPISRGGQQAFTDFDGWLRAEGHQRNPGTSADLVTACLFIAVREEIVRLPLEWPWEGPTLAGP